MFVCGVVCCGVVVVVLCCDTWLCVVALCCFVTRFVLLRVLSLVELSWWCLYVYSVVVVVVFVRLRYVGVALSWAMLCFVVS